VMKISLQLLHDKMRMAIARQSTEVVDPDLLRRYMMEEARLAREESPSEDEDEDE